MAERWTDESGLSLQLVGPFLPMLRPKMFTEQAELALVLP